MTVLFFICLQQLLKFTCALPNYSFQGFEVWWYLAYLEFLFLYFSVDMYFFYLKICIDNWKSLSKSFDNWTFSFLFICPYLTVDAISFWYFLDRSWSFTYMGPTVTPSLNFNCWLCFDMRWHQSYSFASLSFFIWLNSIFDVAASIQQMFFFSLSEFDWSIHKVNHLWKYRWVFYWISFLLLSLIFIL